MKIKCIYNNFNEYSEKSRKRKKEQNNDISSSRLTLGKEYVVYGISEFYKFTHFCICDEKYTYYPMWKPFSLFEITDNRLSRYWIFTFKEEYPPMNNEEKNRPFFSFPEWVKDSYFYDSLTDGEEREVKIFKTYKEIMDLEFPDPSFSEVAQIGDSEWLICPDCIDAWKSTTDRDGMVRCPKCKKIMHNPRYKDDLKKISL